MHATFSRKILIRFFPGFLVLLSLILFSQNSHSSDCTSEIYSDSSFEKQTDLFNIGNEVFLRIYCGNLPPGDHTFSVKWIKDDIGINRFDSEVISQNLAGDREIFFWMKIDSMGFLNRMFSGSDYNEDMIGAWHTESFINDIFIGVNKFNMH